MFYTQNESFDVQSAGRAHLVDVVAVLHQPSSMMLGHRAELAEYGCTEVNACRCMQ